MIQGYAALVDPERLALPILAFVRLRYPTGNYKPFTTWWPSAPRC